MRKIPIIVDGEVTFVKYETEESVGAYAALSQLSVQNSQIQALTERNEFLEDLIAELAVQAYSKSSSA